ncbi:MAG TPA: response regulator [Gemmatimonadales bacterium]|nr:response regulator [Gemmatimonadales bacterium]
MTPAVQPLVLLANADKWLAESLESVLTQGGYRVVAADKRQQIVEQARRARPDAILLDLALDRRSGDAFAVCRALRDEPGLSRATPIVLMTAGPALRAQQIEALRAGAWELRGDPLDMEELVLRLGAYVQGKLELDRLNAQGMIDRVSGLYNEAGLARRSEELAALTARHGLGLACAVFQPSDGSLTGSAADRLALAVKRAGRVSDAVGRTGTAEFTVFAPATDETGAEGLVQRISDSVSRSVAVRLKAGISAVPAHPVPRQSGTAPPRPPRPPHAVSPSELIERARSALGR